MTPNTRKRVLIGAAGIVGLLVVVALALPSLVDLDGRKPEIVAAVKKATGRDLAIEGPIALSILPLPTVTVSGVSFANAPGARTPAMVTVRTATARPSILALLTGRLALSEVTLVDPRIALEVDARGRPNWDFAPPPAAAGAPAAAAAPPPAIGRIVLVNGTVSFADARAGSSATIDKIDATASIGSPEGPFAVAGTATVNKEPLRIDASVGAKSAKGHDVRLALQAGGGTLAFDGALSALGPEARLVGKASSSADNLVAFVETLAQAAGQPEPPLPPLLAGKFAFAGDVDLSAESLAARDFTLTLGEDKTTGSIALRLKPTLAIDARLSAGKLDLDRWLAGLKHAAPVETPPPPAGATAAPAPAPAANPLAAMDARLAVEIGEVVYNRQPVRNVALELDARGGAVAVPRLAATLPGDLVLQAKSTLSGDAARPNVAGEFSLVGPKLRETLQWLAVDVSEVPAGKLSKLSLKGRMSSTGGNVQVSDATFELDDLRGGGGLLVTFGVPLSIVLNLNLDTLDLDSYLAAPAGKPAAGGAASPSSAASASARPRPAGPSVGLKARINRIVYRKDTIGGVEVDVALRGDTLRLNDIKVSNLAGARLALRGSVANLSAAQPRPDLAFNFEAPDMDRVLKLAGVPAAGLGAVTAQGGIAGSIEALSLREFAVRAAGQSLQATGSLALPGAARGMPTAATYKGSLALNGQAVDGTIGATLGNRPMITADLRSNSLDLERLGGAPAAGGGGGRAAAARPIDTAPLRAVDADVKLAAATLVASGLRIGNASLAATLKDGVLTLSSFRGNLYGGTLAFSGTVNASQPALALDLRGDATGLSLSEMLRSTSGSNQFGSAITVTIDGRLNATGISVRGSGATSDQVRASLAGGANLGGHLFVGADRALQMLGSAAAGAASGVIDNTLGQALGIVGQRGGVGVGNMLNAISLVLNRFVNHDSPISGRVEIAGGVLTDRGLAVQGNRATANVVTRTNLAASTTDTTVNFVIAEDPSAPYLVTTARGPLSSPSLGVSRGTAKDPPGMASTLPIPSVPGVGNIPGIGNILPGQGGGQQRSPIPNIPLPIPNIFGR